MVTRTADGSAGDADYAAIGQAYTRYRRPDPRIAARPEALLDPAARLSCSAWSFPGPEVHDRFTRELGRDLADGTWDRRHGHLRTQPALDGSLTLVTSRP